MQTFFQNNKKTVIIGGVILLVVLWIVGIYNGFVAGNQAVNATFAQIDTDLQRRFDLIPNLVSTVKGITKQENDVFGQLANARAHYTGATSNDQKIAASNELQSGLGRLLAISENYPQLRSSEAFTNLMTQLEGTENRIAVSRKDYNNAVSNWNARVSRFPAVIVAKIFNFNTKEFFKVEEQAKENVQVDFSK